MRIVELNNSQDTLVSIISDSEKQAREQLLNLSINERKKIHHFPRLYNTLYNNPDFFERFTKYSSVMKFLTSSIERIGKRHKDISFREYSSNYFTTEIWHGSVPSQLLKENGSLSDLFDYDGRLNGEVYNALSFDAFRKNNGYMHNINYMVFAPIRYINVKVESKKIQPMDDYISMVIGREKKDRIKPIYVMPLHSQNETVEVYNLSLEFSRHKLYIVRDKQKETHLNDEINEDNSKKVYMALI